MDSPHWALALIGLGVAWIGYGVWSRRILDPKPQDFLEIIDGFRKVQKAALANVFETHKTPPNLDTQYFLSSGGAGVYYTVSIKNGSYEHRSSLKLKKYAWYKQRAIQFSLLLMMEISTQFNAAFGEDKGPKLEIGESELGTIHHAFALTAAEHRSLCSAVQKPLA